MRTSGPRRDFLARLATILAGAAAPWIPAGATVAGPGDTSDPGRRLLVAVPGADGLRIGPVPAGAAPPAGGLVLGLFRYDAPGELPVDVERLVLPRADVAAGLYVRSAVAYRTRILLDAGRGGLTARLILARRAPVAVYRETPRPGEVPPCQVVVVVGGGEDASRERIG
jgi:hypothetical protein